MKFYRITALGMSIAMITAGCSASQAVPPANTAAATAAPETAAAETGVSAISETEAADVVTTLSKIDNTKWQYNAEDDVYYQIGISYCETPADEDYETLSVFVPGAYMTAEDNGDGTYTCRINTTATVGESKYTAETAPIVLPVNTPGYSAQAALTEYKSFTQYTDEGFVYVHAGCRGRDAGAPAGITDLKAAIRYIRYNAGNIAGNTDRIFSFGMSGGGAQSALLGVTGDSALYDDYLEAIGAVQGVSDAVTGSQAWCPITSLDSADAAYEWQMGNTRSGLSDEEQQISDDLTAAFAGYINALELTDTDGTVLTLEETSDGRYQAGSYYEYIKSVVEASLNNFLSDTTFPYDSSSSSGHQAGMGPDGGHGGMRPDGGHGGPDQGGNGFGRPDKGDNAPNSTNAENTANVQDAAKTNSGNQIDFTAIDDISRTSSGSVKGVTISGTYETAQDYIDALNSNGVWVNYDAETNTATITDLEAFSEAVKQSGKGIAAFDQLDEGQGENTLFGYGDGKGAHFDQMLTDILVSEGSEYASDYEEDMTTVDALGHTVAERLNMYSPLYYLMKSSEGYGTSTVAQFMRINTGLFQSDTAVTTEANLALALENYDANNTDVDVQFTTVWGMEHTMAERSGDSDSNFIAWVNECCRTLD